MTQPIIVPVQVPGAADGAAALNKAADAAERLGKSITAEKAALAQASIERRKAADAARALAAATQAAIDMEVKETAAIVARAKAEVAAGAERNIRVSNNTQRFRIQRAEAGRNDPDWANDGSSGNAQRSAKIRGLNSFTQAATSAAGIPLPGAGAIAGAIGTGATSIPVLGVIAVAIGAIGYVTSAFDKAARAAQALADTFMAGVAANKQYQAAKAAADQAGLSVFDRTRKNASIVAGTSGDAGISRAQQLAKSQNISIDDALAISADGLNPQQSQAAILASKTLGMSVTEASGKIKAGHWMGTPEQIVAGLSGGTVTAATVAGRASKLATTGYGALADAVDAAKSDASLSEFDLIGSARSGAAANGQNFKDMGDVAGVFKKRLRAEYNEKEGATTDKTEQARLEAEYRSVVSEFTSGKKQVYGAAR